MDTKNNRPIRVLFVPEWYPNEVQRELCGGDDQKEYQPCAAGEVSISGQGVLGSRRNLVEGVLRLHSRDHEETIKRYVTMQGKEDAGQAQLEF